jgi:hypothetical protein
VATVRSRHRGGGCRRAADGRGLLSRTRTPTGWVAARRLIRSGEPNGICRQGLPPGRDDHLSATRSGRGRSAVAGPRHGVVINDAFGGAAHPTRTASRPTPGTPQRPCWTDIGRAGCAQPGRPVDTQRPQPHGC